MREGGLGAPVRHPIDWQDPDFTDAGQIDAELRRVFDICHGCRRCFNLCDAFPTLFDLIDESVTGELDSVDSAGFKKVVDACTLCDMCFMVSCPDVPPHEFDLDFPHLMLRARAAEVRRAAFLAKLGGVEETAFLRLGGETIAGACPRPTWTVPVPKARPPRCSSSISLSATYRPRPFVGPAPRSWSASATPNTATWRSCPKPCARRWPRISIEGGAPGRTPPVPLGCRLTGRPLSNN